MRMPSPTWTVTYAHDRRAHRHRCFGCNKIINAGEVVVMARIAAKTTRAAHEACADKGLGAGMGLTTRQLMEAHAMAHLAACGWDAAKKWCDAQRAKEIANHVGTPID